MTDLKQHESVQPSWQTRYINVAGDVYARLQAAELTVGGQLTSTTNPIPVSYAWTIRKYTATGNGVLDGGTGALAQVAKFKSLTLHLDAAAQAGDTLDISLNHRNGAAYDTLLYTLDMGGVTDVVVDITDFDIILASGDALDWAWDNSGAATYGIEATLIELEGI